MSGNLKNQNKKRNYLIAVLICALTAALASPLRYILDLANIVMLFLLVVFLIALKLGRGPAVMSAFLAVALFDFFFVPPQMSFAVQDVQYLVTFAVMLGVGLATAHLTAMLGKQKEAALEREQHTHRLYELARELAGIINQDQVSEALLHYLSGSERSATVHLIDDNGKLQSISDNVPLSILADMAIQQGRLMETNQISDNEQRTLVFPLISPNGVRGVIVITAVDVLEDIDKVQLQAVANLVAIAIERLHYVDIAQKIQIEATAERLRSSVLSALSHDLRTPLTGLVGMIDALALNADPINTSMRNAMAAIRNQAQAMCNLVDKLLDMARLHAGKINLQKDWRLYEDVIGSAIKLLKPSLSEHPIKVILSPTLPLVEFDDILLERVICNLIENAAKYSPKGQPIEIQGFVDRNAACIEVRDHGYGFSTDKTEELFQMFSRGNSESTIPGVGLGLAICRAIIDAHGGTIKAYNHPDGGACVTLCLPLGNPPKVDSEMENSL
ncbi:MAG: DUF4118 domain-containing protein [Methylotenera sp.]